MLRQSQVSRSPCPSTRRRVKRRVAQRFPPPEMAGKRSHACHWAGGLEAATVLTQNKRQKSLGLLLSTDFSSSLRRRNTPGRKYNPLQQAGRSRAVLLQEHPTSAAVRSRAPARVAGGGSGCGTAQRVGVKPGSSASPRVSAAGQGTDAGIKAAVIHPRGRL